MPAGLEDLPPREMVRLFRALAIAVDELGAHTTVRQIMTLLAIGLANRRDEAIGVSDIDRELGNTPSGTASKLLRSMMHVETERKPGVANTVKSERNQNDFRRWDLYLTPKGLEAVAKVVAALK